MPKKGTLTFGRVQILPIIRVIDGINEAVGRVVSLVALIFAGIIIYDVFMRYVMGEPTRWAFDLTKQLYGFYFILLGDTPCAIRPMSRLTW